MPLAEFDEFAVGVGVAVVVLLLPQLASMVKANIIDNTTDRIL